MLGSSRRGVCVSLALALALTSFPSPQVWAAPTSAASAPDVSLSDLATLDLAALSVPEELGHVVETWQPQDREPAAVVIHLQDLHTHPEAQQHLSGLVGWFRERFGVELVALEGANGLCDTTLYSDFPDPPSTEKISRLFMQEGLFTGAEYYGITNPGKVTLWGVEDEATYLEHLKVYGQGAQRQAQADAILTPLREQLRTLRAQVYPGSLHNLLLLHDAYEGGEDQSFQPYLTELVRLAKAAPLALDDYPNLRAMVQTYELHPQLNTKLVEADRDRLLKTLWPKLTLTQQDALNALAKAVTAKAKPVRLYYEALLRLAAAQGLLDGPQANYHALRRYLDYVTLSAQVHLGKLSEELDALHEAVEHALVTTDEARALARLLKQRELLDGLVHAKLSPRQWTQYRQERAALAPEFDGLRSALPHFEQFYDLAHRRDEAFVRNTLQLLDPKSAIHNPKSAILLITGGFHTSGLTEQLKQQGIAYAVITPSSAAPLDERRYQARLQNEVPPLEELIQKLAQLQGQVLVPGLVTGNIRVPAVGQSAEGPASGKTEPGDDSRPYKDSVVFQRFSELKALKWLRALEELKVTDLADIKAWIDAHQEQAAESGISVQETAAHVVITFRGEEFAFTRSGGTLLAMAGATGEPSKSSKPQPVPEEPGMGVPKEVLFHGTFPHAALDVIVSGTMKGWSLHRIWFTTNRVEARNERGRMGYEKGPVIVLGFDGVPEAKPHTTTWWVIDQETWSVDNHLVSLTFRSASKYAGFLKLAARERIVIPDSLAIYIRDHPLSVEERKTALEVTLSESEERELAEEAIKRFLGYWTMPEPFNYSPYSKSVLEILTDLYRGKILEAEAQRRLQALQVEYGQARWRLPHAWIDSAIARTLYRIEGIPETLRAIHEAEEVSGTAAPGPTEKMVSDTDSDPGAPGASGSGKITPPRVGTTEGHMQEAILLAEAELKAGQQEQAVRTLLDAFRTWEAPEWVRNLQTAVDLLEAANDSRLIPLLEVLRPAAAPTVTAHTALQQQVRELLTTSGPLLAMASGIPSDPGQPPAPSTSAAPNKEPNLTVMGTTPDQKKMTLNQEWFKGTSLERTVSVVDVRDSSEGNLFCSLAFFSDTELLGVVPLVMIVGEEGVVLGPVLRFEKDTLDSMKPHLSELFRVILRWQQRRGFVTGEFSYPLRHEQFFLTHFRKWARDPAKLPFVTFKRPMSVLGLEADVPIIRVQLQELNLDPPATAMGARGKGTGGGSANAPISAWSNEPRSVVTRTDAVPGFDADGPDTIDQQQANVLATLQWLNVEPSTRVLNVGSGIYPLTLPVPWPPPINIDQQGGFPQRAARARGALYASHNVLTLAEAQRDHPAPAEGLPGAVLLYRMGSFVELYHGQDSGRFWQAVWTMVRPGGWVLLMNPPQLPHGPQMPSVWQFYQEFRTALVETVPAEVRLISPSDRAADALVVAVRKPASPSAAPAEGTGADAAEQTEGAGRNHAETRDDP